MDVFDGFRKALETIMRNRGLDVWNKNPGTTVMDAIDDTLRRYGKHPHRFTMATGEQGLGVVMHAVRGPLHVCFLEDEDSNIGASMFYPVNTRYLTSYDIKRMIEDANEHCEGGVVAFNEELQLLSYTVVVYLSGPRSEGTSIDFLLHEASAKISNALEYFDDMRERLNL